MLERKVYVAGKYTSPTKEGVEQNIRLAEEYGKTLAKSGIKVYIPHMATAHWDGGVNTYDYFFDLHLSVLKEWSTDVFLLPNWTDSPGARAEKAYANNNGKTVWYPNEFDELIKEIVVFNKRVRR